eukprot:7270382-Prymnesium_polylepis.1
MDERLWRATSLEELKVQGPTLSDLDRTLGPRCRRSYQSPPSQSHLTVTPPSRHRCTTVTSPLHYRHTSRIHHRYTTVTP